MKEKKAVLREVAQEVFQAHHEREWYESKVKSLSQRSTPSQFYLAFSGAVRKTSKAPLLLTDNQIHRLQAVQPAFKLSTWTIDELCRVVFMTLLPTDTNQAILDKLFDTADMRESVALYKGLYFLDNAAAFTLRAIDGLRTNITHVFDAIALDNAFPLQYFEEAPWNQMVLKALFMQRPIYRIYGLDDRSNKTLALILRDYAHERWSAHRRVSPELWRGIAGFADETFLPDFVKMLKSDSKLEQFAAAKAILESSLPQGESMVKAAGIAVDQLPSWDEIGQQTEHQLNKNL